MMDLSINKITIFVESLIVVPRVLRGQTESVATVTENLTNEAVDIALSKLTF